MPDTRHLLTQVEQDLREGRTEKARAVLEDFDTKNLPRDLRREFANLCRRAGALNQGLRALTPVVRPEGRKNLELEVATASELAEYAVLLQRIGSADEALSILTGLSFHDAPEVLLYRSFCHFNLWQYDQALPLLQEYVIRAPNPYAALVGRVNLAAALLVVPGHAETAREVLAICLQECAANSYSRLQANCLEMLGQLEIQQKNWDQAETCLKDAAEILTAARVFDQLFVRKWQAVIAARRDGDTTAIENFRQEAIQRGEPEAVREADLNLLHVNFDPKKFADLYAGTNFSGYRERILRTLNVNAPVGDVIRGKGPHIFDLREGLGDKSHQLIEILARDFYRPAPIAWIFSKLYPGEHFDIFSSPNRVHQAIHRTRDFFAANGTDIKIEWQTSGFRLVIAGEWSMRIAIQRAPVVANDVLLTQLKSALHHDFTGREAREVLRMTERSFLRWAQWAQAQGALQKFGAGPRTRYQIVA